MVYLGSKSRLLSTIIPAIQEKIYEEKIDSFYDVFCGGANICDHIKCKNIYANDLSPTLIALHKQAQNDFSKIPSKCSREDWDRCYTQYKRIIKNLSPYLSLNDYQKMCEDPLYFIGAIEWYGSFSTGGFIKGFAKNTSNRNFYNDRYKNHFKQSQSEIYKQIKFTSMDYRLIDIPANALIYCDPPYSGKTFYQINKNFNHYNFYKWLEDKSKTNPIFISEYTMPENFTKIASCDITVTVDVHNKSRAIDSLFFIDNR